ncbi:MAG TPA: CPBP family intramembrane glutamic endopeptidase, partial [Actinomycetota bacterium]|nr:CPBP family intramembrane glutamic endopeptidase [Actinomycetota bacterium]
ASEAPVVADDRTDVVRWSGWHLLGVLVLGLALGVGLGIVAIAILGGPMEEGLTVAQASAAGVMVYVGIAFTGWSIALRRRHATFADAGFRWVGIAPILLAIPLVLGLMFATGLVIWATDALIGGVPSAQEQVAPVGTTLTRSDLYWLLLVGAVAAPVVEEFFFRGLLFNYLKARAGLWMSILGSSALFAVMHFIPPLIPALLVFGAIQALVVHRLKSLYPAILLHAINNWILLVGVYSFLK